MVLAEGTRPPSGHPRMVACVKFYLGTHEQHWLARSTRPLFVSHRRLARQLPKRPARTRWALDSGGFSELSMFGEWQTTPQSYASAVRRYSDTLGSLDWAAPQDWMCEPWIVAKTGLSVADHQNRTIGNFLDLRALDDRLPFMPVLQGWTLGDYVSHVEQYADAGIRLTDYPTVGVGSVCRRQATSEIDEIFHTLRGLVGDRLHGFGVKTGGLSRYGALLKSADSMAWSYAGRRRPNPSHHHNTCASCFEYAMAWAARIDRSPIPGRFVFDMGEAA